MAMQQNWARLYIICQIWLRGFHSSKIVDFTLPKKVQIIMCKTDLDLIWMAWSGFGQMHLVWKQASEQESSGSVLAECNQPAASFPLSDSVYVCVWLSCSSTDVLNHIIVQNQPGSDSVLADCVRFWPDGWIEHESMLVCKNHWACFWTTLPSWSRSSMFTTTVSGPSPRFSLWVTCK